jgi:tetratricopeptide (TPR) repeat protein
LSATEFLKKATSLEPDFAIAYFNLGIVSLRLKTKDGALDQYAVLKNLDHDMARKLFGMVFKQRLLDVAQSDSGVLHRNGQ